MNPSELKGEKHAEGILAVIFYFFIPLTSLQKDMKFASQSLHIITPDAFSVSNPNMTFFFFFAFL